MKKAVVLLSGGVDSTTTAFIARKKDHREVHALTFLYGQRHSKETDFAIKQMVDLDISLKMFYVPLDMIGGSSLTGEGEIPTEGILDKVPSSWVPQRNTIFLAIAFGWAEVIGADFVYIGTNVVDYSGYPDCRPEFIHQLEKALNLASKRFVEEGRGIGLIAPLSGLSKAEIIKVGTELGVDFGKTWSCYQGGARACGVCDSCRIRLKGFKEAGLTDPLVYE